MPSIVIAIICVLTSLLFGALRLEGFRSESFQALAHGLVFSLFTSGCKNLRPEIMEWWCYERKLGLWYEPSWNWYQFGLGVGLSLLELYAFLNLPR